VGSGVPRFYLPMDQIFPQSNVSQFIVIPKDLKVREALRVRLPACWPGVSGGAWPCASCCPTARRWPYPVQFRVVGPEPELLLRQRYADEVKAVMRQNPEHARRQRQLERVGQGAAPGSGPGQGARAGGDQPVDRAGLADDLDGHPWASTAKATSHRHRAAPAAGRAQQPSPTSGNAYLPTASGKSIPDDPDAKPVFTWEPGVMWRENRDYAITVQCDIVEGLQGATVTAELLPACGRWSREMGPGGRGVTGSRWPVRWRRAARGRRPSSVGVPIMLFITFTLLMLQLHSFSRAMLVFLTGPWALPVWQVRCCCLNRPFGFVALLGVIALMGMIQRNSVILIDQIEQDRAAGVPAWEAIVESAVRRLRPIVLTAAAAVLAMIPLSRSVFLGADGGGHHGRADRGDRADPAGFARHVRGLVPCSREHASGSS
jgi:multidrug efflux pump